MPAELIHTIDKFQEKARGSIQACFMWLWDMGVYGISLTGQWAETMDMNITTYPLVVPVWHLGDTRYSLLYRLDCSSLQRVLAQGQGSPWSYRTLKIYKGCREQILRELDMKHRQSIPLCMLLSLRALIRPHSLQEQKPRYSSPPPAPGTGC